MDYCWEKCPHCGKKVQVPFQRESIRCVFCQKEIEVKKLMQEKREKAVAFDFERGLPDALFEPQVPMRDFSKESYESTFSNYYAQAEPVLRQFSAYYEAFGKREQDVWKLAQLSVKRIQDKMDAHSVRFDTVEYFSFVYLIVAYLCPAILKAEESFSDPLADAVIGLWNQKYPKNPIQKATYEKVYGGFKRKLCFVTTAVCRSLHKPDDCEELNALRTFRDDYLLHTKDGKAKVNVYYMLAPLIVEAIDRSPHAEKEYQRIYSDYLLFCLREIQENRLQECGQRYEQMMRELQCKWFYSEMQ